MYDIYTFYIFSLTCPAKESLKAMQSIVALNDPTGVKLIDLACKVFDHQVLISEPFDVVANPLPVLASIRDIHPFSHPSLKTQIHIHRSRIRLLLEYYHSFFVCIKGFG